MKCRSKIWKVHPQIQLSSIELEERKLTLLERQIKLRKETAEAEAIELKIQQLKMSLGLTL